MKGHAPKRGGPAKAKAKPKTKPKTRTANGRPKISVRKTRTVATSKGERQVVEKYTPKGRGKAKTGFTATGKTAASRAASQTGRSHPSDRNKVARAPGKRTQRGRSGQGTVYYEYRRNRSDADKRRRR